MQDIHITPREDWGAQPPTHRRRITTPTPELWLHHSAGPNDRGPAALRRIQHTHMDKGWSDIAYSYIIDPSTFEIFEGRGPGIAGAHTQGHNSVSHGICVLGNFETMHVPAPLIDTIAALTAHGHRRDWWPNQLTGGHRDTKPTACPGRHLYDAIPAINTRTAELLDQPTGATTMTKTITVPDPETATIQELLLADGYDPGPIDGTPGPKLLAAVRAALAAHDDTMDRLVEAQRQLTERSISLDDAELGAAYRAAADLGEAKQEAYALVDKIYGRQSTPK